MKKINPLHSDIYMKVVELIKVSSENFDELLGVKGGGWSDKFNDKMKRQEKLMDELKVLAKARKTIYGRVLQFPMADSYALYLITYVGKSKVAVTWLNYCDGWQDDRLGAAGELPLDYATKAVNGRDALDELFSVPKVKTNV